MTEKRFKLGYVCGDFGLIDNDEWIDLYSMSENSEKNVRICIDKMNQLADENEQLKKYKILFEQLQLQLKGVKKLSDLDHKDFEDLIELTKGRWFEQTDEHIGWKRVDLE